MKPKGVLAISLGINLGLMVVLACYSTSRPAVSRPSAERKTVVAGKTQIVEHAVSEVITNQTGPAFNWRSVESADYKIYIARLREIECPEETIRDIIIADVDKLYAPRFAALRPPEEKEYKYWRRNSGWRSPDPERQKQYRALTEEKDALIKELLGVDSKVARGTYNWWDDERKEQLSFLSEDKQEQLRKLQEKFNDERQKIYAETQGYWDEDTQADLKKIHKRELAEMAKFMTPEEIFEYEMRTSDTANNLKRELASLKPTEEEFRELYRLRSAMDDYQNPTEEQRKDKDFWSKSDTAEKDSTAKMKELLGDERYAEYQRDKDYAYQSLARGAEFLGYDKAAAIKVYDMKGDAEKAANQVRNDQSLTTEQRNEKLKAIRAQTVQAIKENIGEKGYKAYRRQGGYWISNIYNN